MGKLLNKLFSVKPPVFLSSWSGVVDGMNVNTADLILLSESDEGFDTKVDYCHAVERIYKSVRRAKYLRWYQQDGGKNMRIEEITKQEAAKRVSWELGLEKTKELFGLEDF